MDGLVDRSIDWFLIFWSINICDLTLQWTDHSSSNCSFSSWIHPSLCCVCLATAHLSSQAVFEPGMQARSLVATSHSPSGLWAVKAVVRRNISHNICLASPFEVLRSAQCHKRGNKSLQPIRCLCEVWHPCAIAQFEQSWGIEWMNEWIELNILENFHWLPFHIQKTCRGNELEFKISYKRRW